MSRDGLSRKPMVFLSYARKDGEEFATQLRKWLQKEEPEITLWQDRTEMEGGVGWWKQIEDALDRVSFLVIVMTPAAMQSEVTRKEWRYARQRGVNIYPVKGCPEAELDYAILPNWMRKAHFFDLDREWQKFVNFLMSDRQPVRVPFMTPNSPEGFVPRPREFEQLVAQLVAKNVVLTSPSVQDYGKLSFCEKPSQNSDLVARNPRVSRRRQTTLFLQGLNPPAIVNGLNPLEFFTVEAAPPPIEDAMPDPTPTHIILIQQVDEAQGQGDFLKAKNLLFVIREMMKPQTAAESEDPYILQRLALVTYKAKYPSFEESLREARMILQTLNPGTCNDPETLGLWGSVHKRLWEVTKNSAFLDDAVRAYERAFYLRNDYYNGINFAFLLNIRAANAVDPADAIADFVQARRVRREVLTICEDWLVSNPAPVGPAANAKALKQYQKNRYWVLATKAEAHLGLGEQEQSKRCLEQSNAGEPWMKEARKSSVENLGTCWRIPR
jgi:hypothetical protein